MGKVTTAQAEKYGVTLAELEQLAQGKECSTYPGETLHVRRVRGGKLVVFNVSERARGEAISATKQERKARSTGGSRSTVAVAAAPAT